MKVASNATELIGNTPLVELTNYESRHDLKATIIGKAECFNPAGSIKDRIAKAMIEEAVKAGKIDDDTVIIEPTSGNTGIGLCSIAAARGNRIIITMPETMSIERRNLMKAYGAELVLTEGAKGMKGAIAPFMPLAPSVRTSSAPYAFIRLRRSIDMVSGMVMIMRLPRAAAMEHSPIPVLPDVGSMITVSSSILPALTASSIMALAILSLIEPAGLKHSALPMIVAFRSCLLS